MRRAFRDVERAFDGNAYRLSAASEVPVQTLYAARKRGGEIRDASVCLRLARAWRDKTGADDAAEVAIARALAGLD